MNVPAPDARAIAENAGAGVDDAPPTTAIGAAHLIHAWHTTVREVAPVAHAQIMESWWVIRQEHPERPAFDAFLHAQGLDRFSDVDQAWLMADTWDVARRQRSLRDLAADHPSDAVSSVWEFVQAGRKEDLAKLNENNRKVAEILSLPPRKRTAAIHDLVEYRLERLDLAPAEPPPSPPPPPNTAGELEKCIGELREMVQRLDGLAHVLPDRLAGDSRNRSRRERILPLTDLATGALDNIASAAAEAAERFADGV